MGVSQRVKSKYVFRLPISFLKAKRMNVKGKDIDAGDDLDQGLYASVPHTVRVQYEPDVESEIESDEDVDLVGIGASGSAATRKRKGLVSWDGVKNLASNRWTIEQEKQLVHARAELARCQKAWSSEQDIWLKYIEELSEEKEAHEEFLNNRAKHIGDEQNHFRKAWDRNRRRSEQDQPQERPQRLTPGQRTASLPVRLGKLRGRN